MNSTQFSHIERYRWTIPPIIFFRLYVNTILKHSLYNKLSLKLSKQQLFDVLKIGLIGSTLTNCIALAIISGVFYAYYMVGMDHSSVRELNPFVFKLVLRIFEIIGVNHGL